ncbi:MAG: ADP-ribosylglycohydrolase family protein [Pseudomonadota bacterium]
MLGAIAGDIVGSRFEGGPAPRRDFELFHRDCAFTDDTVCTVAVAEALLQREDFAATLRRFVRRHPHRGYGGMFLHWALADDAPAYGSWGNGAPMRVAAVGWLASGEHEARALARAQAAVSHDHPDALAAAEAVALAIFLLRRGAGVPAVRARLADAFDFDLDPPTALTGGAVDVSSRGTVGPALSAAFEAADWVAAVRTAVGLGGDTDTVACIAGGVAEAAHGLPAEAEARALAYLTDDLRAVVQRFRRKVEHGG